MARAPSPVDPVVGALIVYRTSWESPTRANQFCQRMFGQSTSSGGYRYRRRGVMEGIAHWRPARNVIVVKGEDRDRVLRALGEWTREIHCWSIVLKPEQLRKLSKLTEER